MFELAGRLGCTVEELGARLSYAEFVEWKGYKAHRVMEITRLARKKPPQHLITDW